DRVYCTKNIRGVADRHQFCLMIDSLFHLVLPENAVLRDFDEHNLGTGVLSKQLPGHYVAVMFHDRDYYFVAFAHIISSPRIGDKIDSLRRVPYEDYLFGMRGIREPRCLLSRFFIRQSCLFGQFMDSSMDVCVILAII